MSQSTPMHELTYNQALREGLHQAMELSPDVVVMGQLVDYKSGIFGTTSGLFEAFGPKRVLDFPVAEATMTSAALGAAVGGLRPVLVHQRLDFMIYSVDCLVNWLSLWRFKSNGKSSVPVVIRAIVGKGWGQGPQHSKSLHAWFAHLPGLKVAMPATAYDAKGLLLESIFGEDPCLIIEGRSLYSMKSPVPEAPYRVRYGEASVPRPGKDLTLVAVGYLVPVALKAALLAKDEGIDVEVIDLRTIAPWDRETVCKSVQKTGRLIVADPGWSSVGFAGEVVTTVVERLGRELKSNPKRVTLPDSHTPMSQTLEKVFYPDEKTILKEIRASVKGD